MGNREYVTVRRVEASLRVWLILLVYAYIATQGVSGGSIHAADGLETGWIADFQDAEAAARKAGVPMVIHFWAPWCGPCRNMEAEVLTSLEVKAALGDGIVGVKVNSDERQDLVARFGVSALPTDVFVSADGTVLSRSVGSPGLEGYLAKLTQFRVTHPAPASSFKPQTTVAVQADTEVETVTAAKPVFAELNNPEKLIVKLSNSKSAANSGGAKSPSETDSAKLPSSLPLAMNRALRRVAGLRLGLSGYSPVTLTVATKWQVGNPQFAYSFQGVRYQLTSAEELEEFKANPKRFVPALHGCDPVSLVKGKVAESGFIELGATFRSRMYFFATKASRQEFLKSPEKFATDDHPSHIEAVQAASSDTENLTTAAAASVAVKPTSMKRSAASTAAE